MKKIIIDKDVFYSIEWSKIYEYDKYRARGIPELPGIICLLYKTPGDSVMPLLFYGCWRDGLRVGLRNTMDLSLSSIPEITKQIDKIKKIAFKYAIVDTTSKDMKDILYWLIKEYHPKYNNFEDFADSKRYKDVYLKETFPRDEYSY